MALSSPRLSRLQLLRKKYNNDYLDINSGGLSGSQKNNGKRIKLTTKGKNHNSDTDIQKKVDNHNSRCRSQTNNDKYSILLSRKRKNNLKKCISAYIGGSIYDNNEIDCFQLSSAISSPSKSNSCPKKTIKRHYCCSNLRCTKCNSNVIRLSGNTKNINIFNKQM